jgi:GT2 family glycosyltransferase
MTIWYEPYAEVVHLGSASSNKTYPVIQMFRGLIYLYKKHHSKLQLRLVQYLLTFKALLGIVIGRLIRSTYLVHTYTQSLKVIYE